VKSPSFVDAALPLVGAIGRNVELHLRDDLGVLAVRSESFLRDRFRMP
jgi:hypothetical protein